MNLNNYKKDFPIFKNNKDLVYLDTGASAQKPKVFIDKMTEIYSNDYANIHRGLYSLSAKATNLYEETREYLKKFFNVPKNYEVVFTRSATEALNLLAYSYKDKIVATTISEHHSNFVPWQNISKEFHVLDIQDANYQVSNGLYPCIKDKNIDIVAIQHMSNVTGAINDIYKIVEEGSIISNQYNKKELITIVDGSQSSASLPIDISIIKPTFFVGTAHKMYGPNGLGFIIGNRDKLDSLPPFNYGGDMVENVSVNKTTFAKSPARFEAGTPSIVEAIAFKASLEYMNNIGMNEIHKHTCYLADLLQDELNEISGINVFRKESIDSFAYTDKSSVVSFNAEWAHPFDINSYLSDKNICVRSGLHCAEPLIKRLNTNGTIRASFGIYNNINDVEKLVKSIKKLYKFHS